MECGCDGEGVIGTRLAHRLRVTKQLFPGGKCNCQENIS